jgi:hypothetical protein
MIKYEIKIYEYKNTTKHRKSNYLFDCKSLLDIITSLSPMLLYGRTL